MSGCGLGFVRSGGGGGHGGVSKKPRTSFEGELVLGREEERLGSTAGVCLHCKNSGGTEAGVIR